jgi:hypothetical protein
MNHGRDRRSKKRDQDRNTNLKRSDSTAYIRARLKRDGREDLLEKIARGETTANAVAINLKWRSERISVKATVDGFAAAAPAYPRVTITVISLEKSRSKEKRERQMPSFSRSCPRASASGGSR